MQELTEYKYYSSSGRITLTLPSLQFWTMIVIEPEKTTTQDNVCYAPAVNGEYLGSGITSTFEAGSANTNMWNLQLDEDTYNVRVDIPAGTLTLQGDNEDAVVLPLGESSEKFFTPAGMPATKHTRGILISKDKKVYFRSE